jgi:protein-L-isoaspartate(D-aspartate) O-methyltransferase
MELAEAIASVDRKQFLPPEVVNEPWIDDFPVPMGPGQSVPTALMTALFVQLAGIGPDSVVMEVGTGSGYQAAILARIVKTLHTFEIRDVPADLISKLPENVTIYHRDAVCDLPDIQVDAILVTCDTPGPYKSWKRVLKDGGVIVIPVRGEIRKYERNNFRFEDMGTFAYAKFVDVESPHASEGIVDDEGL